jgi:hypothetical protein
MGKVIAGDMLETLEKGAREQELDASTRGLSEFVRTRGEGDA